MRNTMWLKGRLIFDMALQKRTWVNYIYFTIVYCSSKLWYYGTLIYYGKNYGTMNKNLWFYGQNYGTKPKII